MKTVEMCWQCKQKLRAPGPDFMWDGDLGDCRICGERRADDYGKVDEEKVAILPDSGAFDPKTVWPSRADLKRYSHFDARLPKRSE